MEVQGFKLARGIYKIPVGGIGSYMHNITYMFVYKRSGRGRVREGNNKGNEEEQRYGEEIRD